MKGTVLLGSVSLLLLCSLGSLIFFHVNAPAHVETSKNASGDEDRLRDTYKSQHDMQSMLRLIREQNETISRMA